MSDTMQDPKPATEPTAPRLRRRPYLVGAVAVTVAAAIGVAVLASRSDDSTSQTQLASIRQACVAWGGQGSPAACNAMVDWMSQQMGSGRMTPMMMWGDQGAMRSTCQAWMGSTPAVTGGAPADAAAWCDAMATSMASQIGDWSQWMMNGHMGGMP